MKFLQPEVYGKSFTCPHCGTISKQDWWHIDWDSSAYSQKDQNAIKVGFCQHCEKNTLWIYRKMYYPENGNAPFPNPEMPDSVKKIYLEAASIHTKSPRGAAGLLRLSIQVLCEELGESGKNINKDIASLVQKGLPTIVQQSLDIVRVTGNEAVHPGQIDTDDAETVGKLFELVNVIVEYMIALPKKVSGIYSSLPSDKVTAIENRDKR